MRVSGLRKWVGGGTPEIGRTEVGSLWFRMSSVKSWRTSKRRQLLEGQAGSQGGALDWGEQLSSNFLLHLFFFFHSPSFCVTWIFLKKFICF